MKTHWRSKPYREWVATLPSIITGSRDRVVPHHHRHGSDGGTGLKPSDSYCVPVTYDEHIDVHSGKIAIDDLDALRACVRQITEYLVEKKVR